MATICYTLHPLLPLLLLTAALINLFTGNQAKKKDVQIRQENAPLDREMEYLSTNVGEPALGKDVRIYGLEKWLSEKYTSALEKRVENEKKIQDIWMNMKQLKSILAVSSNLVIYIYLITETYAGKLGSDDFVLYLGATATLNTAFHNMIESATNIMQYSKCITDFRNVMELPEEFEPTESVSKKTEKMEQILPNESISIKFRDVSYRYKSAKEPVLKNLNFEIKNGERVAVIGVNGAGKTTLMKLVTGLLCPDAGTIFLNDIDAAKFPRLQRYELFSVVLQEIQQYALTIEQNVALGEIEEERMKQALEASELLNLIHQLPKGKNTMLRKDYASDGILLSGGQAQTLALARALYRDGSVLILDEPTAALDALAEERLYRRFDELSKGKTVLFISHRLASTRFCDRILVMDGGRIEEQGTHTELLERGGLYAKMYQSQFVGYSSEMEVENA